MRGFVFLAHFGNFCALLFLRTFKISAQICNFSLHLSDFCNFRFSQFCSAGAFYQFQIWTFYSCSHTHQFSHLPHVLALLQVLILPMFTIYTPCSHTLIQYEYIQCYHTPHVLILPPMLSYSSIIFSFVMFP